MSRHIRRAIENDENFLGRVKQIWELVDLLEFLNLVNGRQNGSNIWKFASFGFELPLFILNFLFQLILVTEARLVNVKIQEVRFFNQ